MLFFHSSLYRRPRMNGNGEFVFVALLLLALSSFKSYAEVVHFRECPKPTPDAVSNCTIHEVRVDPCREAAENKPCKIKRGHNSSISFDYTPNFDGEKLETRGYWASALADLPFLGMNSDACTMTKCPVVSGQKQTYNVQLFISKKFPVRTYDLKWKMWNEREQECCFMFQIKLHK
ncbi:PREDICTED: MD-2-related lipid-recognition protein-like [Polistes dominula]|uniref:MD-2-related lipid-recognition protein-like n=1 Tax=Polistes dominula TaxID=743375 RepID=A0ABM1HUI4_POLDO|nr:PREDICTED: MD-2-related lipid-recognition protein-like [Polistes dominula]